MRFTKEQKIKMGENVDKIKAYIQTLQPQICDIITVDFGELKSYRFETERECHIYVDRDEIRGRIGGLQISFERQSNSSSSADVYNWLQYTWQLIESWQYIKRALLKEIEKRKAIIETIENFEV